MRSSRFFGKPIYPISQRPTHPSPFEQKSFPKLIVVKVAT
jgi:hypothetical protein